jgi:hypothetical protein
MRFEERRQAQVRVAEIDRVLRELSEEVPEAVRVAGWDIEAEHLINSNVAVHTNTQSDKGAEPTRLLRL